MFFKTFLRNIRRNGIHSIINIGGLAVVLLACMYIYIHVRQEMSVDQFHESGNRIYRITHDERGKSAHGRYLPTVGPPVGPAVAETFAEVENQVRFRYSPNHILSVGDKRFYENRIFYADSSLFQVFGYSLKQGNEKNALHESNSVIITAEMALKYFGEEHALGKTILFDHQTALTVTGVLDKTKRSHLEFDFLLPFHDFKVPPGYPVTLQDWGWISFHTYILVAPDANIPALEEKLSTLVEQHWPVERRKFKFGLQPLHNIYFGEPRHEHVQAGNEMYVYSLVAAGVLLMLIAIFNYTNITTALSLGRAKEVGVRKTLGASRGAVSRNFMAESLLAGIVSYTLALVFLLPATAVTGGDLLAANDVAREMFTEVAVVFLFFTLMIGLAASIYPSLVLSRFKPVSVLKGAHVNVASGVSLRSVLTCVQFVITICITIASVIVSHQISFIRSKDLGFDQYQLLVLNVPGDLLRGNYHTIREQFLAIPHVEGVSVGGGRMDGDNGNVPIRFEGLPEPMPLAIDALYPDFFKTTGIRMIAGRELSWDVKTDTAEAILVNEATLRLLGWTADDALGKTVEVGRITSGKIVGVVADHHAASLHEAIGPMVMYFPRTHLTDLYVRFEQKTLADVIPSLQQTWSRLYPELPFDYVLLSDHLQTLYSGDIRFHKLVRFFSVLAMVTACLGLYGITSLMIRYRMKDLSIRKVFGASSLQMFLLLAKPVIVLFLVATAIAVPVSWYYGTQWLNGFTFHFQLSALQFFAATVLVGAALLFVIAVRFRMVIMLNPAKVLRDS